MISASNEAFQLDFGVELEKTFFASMLARTMADTTDVFVWMSMIEDDTESQETEMKIPRR